MKISRNAVSAVVMSLLASCHSTSAFTMHQQSQGLQARSSMHHGHNMVAKSIFETNKAIDKLAEDCSDINNNVVLLASKAEDIFQRAEIKDTVSLNSLLKAWSRACDTLNQQRRLKNRHTTKIVITSVEIYTPRDAAEHCTRKLMEAERVFQQDPENATIIPDEISYNAVIEAWAKTAESDATSVAERLLKKMIENDRLRPNIFTYNAVLDAWAHSSDPNAVERMRKIWDHMEKFSDSLGTQEAKPYSRTANMVLQGIAKTIETLPSTEEKMECAQEARSFLEHLKASPGDFKPSVMSYTIVMDAFSKVGTLEAAMEVEELMADLKQLAETSKKMTMEPTVRTYTVMISAWGRSNAPQAGTRAMEILEEMQEKYERRLDNPLPIINVDDTTKPNMRTFNSLFLCFNRSQDPNKARYALKTLMKMRDFAKSDFKLAPTLHSYNIAIDCCTRTTGEMSVQMDAIKIAFAILKTIEQSGIKPNHRTYSNLMNCCSNLLLRGEERNKIATTILEKSIAAGQVTVEIVISYRKTVDDAVARKLLEPFIQANGNYNYEQIPESWSKNVIIHSKA